MSTTIDNRVVEMRFDNRHFENNVQTSLSTLDKLKKSLNLQGAAKGLENIDSTAKGMNFSGLSGAVETVQARFSALGVMGVTALANITNSAVNAGKRIASALTIDPIMQGFSEYETQINAVQTILANTKSKGTTIDDVNAALDELNTYADKTIYNFTEMTRNIGTFTAAGVDLDTSVSAIQGIANLAAVSGSNSQQASTAMYQLSQALAAGKVQLMDWNSVVNAGMGGEVFQNALIRTAAALDGSAKNVDAWRKANIDSYGSFRDSLTEGEWLTSEVLTTTLKQFTLANTEANKQMLISQGYSEKQAQEILEMAETATDAATKVKTFTQLWDTMKEAAQSGWTQTWEILVGDFEEAKELLTTISDTFGVIINASSEARNKVLQGWKDEGGRTMLIESFSNAFEGLKSIIIPIKEAFREIFPPITVKQLLAFTEGLKDLTSKFVLSEESSNNLKRTFKGLFAVIDIGWQAFVSVAEAIGSLLGPVGDLGGGILGVTAAVGDWLVGFDDAIKKSEFFDTVLGNITSAIEKFISFAKEKIALPGLERMYERFSEIRAVSTEVSSGISSIFDAIQTSIENSDILGVFETLIEIVKKLSEGIGDALGALTSGVSESLGNTNFDAIFDIFNSVALSSIAVFVARFVKGFSDMSASAGSFKENVLDILDEAKGCFEAYQTSLKAEALIKIASAIAILAASLLVISLIDSEKLAAALGSIAVLFADLMGAMALFGKFNVAGILGTASTISTMIAMSTAILILASALKKIGDLNPEQLLVGLGGVIGLTATLIGAVKLLGMGGANAMKGATQMVIFAAAVKVLASACSDLSTLNWNQLAVGLVGVGVLLGELAIFAKLTSGTGHLLSTGVALIAIGAGMKVLASAVNDIGEVSTNGNLITGLLGMAGALAAITIAVRLMPTNMVGMGVGLIAVSTALVILSKALSSMGGMENDAVGKSLVTLGVSMGILAAGLYAMTGSLAGSAALLVAAAALAMLTPPLSVLGAMSWESIAKGLVVLASSFAIIGVAGLLLTPIIPSIIALSAALLLIGGAVALIGTGVAIMHIGDALGFLGSIIPSFSLTMASFSAGIKILLQTLIELIPLAFVTLGEGLINIAEVIAKGAPVFASAVKAIVLSLVDVLIECVPALAEGALRLVIGVLGALVEYSPQIIELLFQFIFNLLDGLTAHIPDLIQKAMEVISAFFSGVIAALSGLDVTVLSQGVAGVALLSVMMVALGALVPLIPNAMIGVLGMGVLIAELALVLAAVGALAQIPGLQWLIGEGGQLLQAIGTAIGQFVGGIVGGFMGGVSSSFPQIATDLSNFMTNLQPFIDGAKQLDETMMSGVRALAETILILTAANILDGIASFIGFGGGSLSSFGTELASLGTSMNQFATNLGAFDETKLAAVTCAANAIKVMAQAADTIPNEGGWAAKIFGDNSIAAFGEQMPSLGSSLSSFATNLGTFNEATVTTVTCAADAIKAMSQAAKGIDGQADWAKKIFGDDGLAAFGEQMPSLGKSLKSFVSNLGTFNEAQVATVKSAVSAVKALAGLTKTDLKAAKNNLPDFGEGLPDFAKDLSSFCTSMPSSESVTTAVTNIQKIVKMVNDVADADPSSAEDFADSLKNMGKAGVKAFVEAFTSSESRSNVKRSTSELIAKAIEGVEDKEPAFKTAAKKLAISSITVLRDQYNSFYTAGSYLVSGFANGISDNSYKAEAKARAMANAAARAAKRALDEHSPSRVFYEIGDFAGLGFVNALDDYGSISYNAGRNMADSARLGLSNAVDKIRTFLNSDMDTQPTIRPVLDLSDIQSGAGTIGRLFGNGVSIGALNNVGAISSMMAHRNQNGTTDDVISAIEDLRRTIGNTPTNTYNVNGITYDDGSNISDAVRTLVRAARVERRI